MSQSVKIGPIDECGASIAHDAIVRAVKVGVSHEFLDGCSRRKRTGRNDRVISICNQGYSTSEIDRCRSLESDMKRDASLAQKMRSGFAHHRGPTGCKSRSAYSHKDVYESLVFTFFKISARSRRASYRFRNTRRVSPDETQYRSRMSLRGTNQHD